MAIATTLPIKFSDVCLELYGSSDTTGRSLNQEFIDATGTFDPTYENINGYRNSLQNFRGYAAPLQSLTRNITVGYYTTGGFNWYGYDPRLPNSFGSIDNTDISAIAGLNAIVYFCYFAETGPNGIFLYIANGSSVTQPTGFSSISVGGIIYTLATAYVNGVYSSSNSAWEYSWRNVINGFGTTTGIIKELTLYV
tara:strand:+ start:1064 stop:1648 length:585 start_codon:yes stop_codon:yes gene_type:complete